MERIRTDIMNMPIRIYAESVEGEEIFNRIFSFLEEVDARFSTYKEDSEVSRYNRGEIARTELSPEFLEVLSIAESARERSHGYFDITRADGSIDPSGVVKGWAIQKAAHMLSDMGVENYVVDIAGDIASSGVNAYGNAWSFGIQNPFTTQEVVKVLRPRGKGLATSGSYARGAHIYNPHDRTDSLGTIVSTTVIAPSILEADLLATAAHAMGKGGIVFLETLPDVEGYAIDAEGIATATSGLASYAHA